MIFNIQRERLLHPLSEIIGVVEKKQTLAILGNLLIKAYGSIVSITASDSEVEMVASCQSDIVEEGVDDAKTVADSVVFQTTANEFIMLAEGDSSKVELKVDTT